MLAPELGHTGSYWAVNQSDRCLWHERYEDTSHGEEGELGPLEPDVFLCDAGSSSSSSSDSSSDSDSDSDSASSDSEVEGSADRSSAGAAHDHASDLGRLLPGLI